MTKVYSIDGITPVVDPSAYVHPSAVLIGDVIVGPRAYIGPCACLRGDFGRIVVEAGANVQDTCVMHGFPGKDTVVGAGANIGHGAVLHGCVIGRGALIGMNCVVNDNAEIGEDTVVAAMAFVRAEAKIISGIGRACAQHSGMIVDRNNDGGQENKELFIVMRSFSGLKQINSVVGSQGPVVVFAGTIDTRERFFMEQANEIMTQGHFLHGFHHELNVIGGDIGG